MFSLTRFYIFQLSIAASPDRAFGKVKDGEWRNMLFIGNADHSESLLTILSVFKPSAFGLSINSLVRKHIVLPSHIQVFPKWPVA